MGGPKECRERRQRQLRQALRKILQVTGSLLNCRAWAGQSTGIPACSPHARKYLYVGKSCAGAEGFGFRSWCPGWPERDLFHGHIAELKVGPGV